MYSKEYNEELINFLQIKLIEVVRAKNYVKVVKIFDKVTRRVTFTVVRIFERNLCRRMKKPSLYSEGFLYV